MEQRCRYTEYALAAGITPQRGQRAGVFMGPCRDGRCVKVRWDGNKTPSIYHKDFIEVIPVCIIDLSRAPTLDKLLRGQGDEDVERRNALAGTDQDRL